LTQSSWKHAYKFLGPNSKYIIHEVPCNAKRFPETKMGHEKWATHSCIHPTKRTWSPYIGSEIPSLCSKLQVPTNYLHAPWRQNLNTSWQHPLPLPQPHASIAPPTHPPPSSIFKSSRILCTLIQESKVIGSYISSNKNLIGTHLRVPLIFIMSICIFYASYTMYNIIVIFGKMFIKYPIF
jgi:hypothetical protein